jgi:hypothetical protein
VFSYPGEYPLNSVDNFCMVSLILSVDKRSWRTTTHRGVISPKAVSGPWLSIFSARFLTFSRFVTRALITPTSLSGGVSIMSSGSFTRLGNLGIWSSISGFFACDSSLPATRQFSNDLVIPKQLCRQLHAFSCFT